MDGAKALKDEPNDAARLYFRSFFFGAQHPYGRPVRGDEQTLARVQRADMSRRMRSGMRAKHDPDGGR